jgi:hypothetical protein
MMKTTFTFIAGLIVIATILSCSSTANNSVNNQTDSTKLPNVSPANALKIIDSVTKDIPPIKADDILYENDKGYNKEAAEKAKQFVLEKMEISVRKNQEISVGFIPLDSSYLIQILTPTGGNRSQSNFFQYYPKTKVILNGVTFDTLYTPWQGDLRSRYY